jgi:hypothetical protein
MTSVYLIESSATEAEAVAENVLGALADVGTTAELALEGVRGFPLDSVEALCVRLGPVRVVRACVGVATPAARLRAELEVRSAHEAVFAVMAAPEDSSPLMAVAGPELPAMGLAAPCDLAQLEASLRYTLGDLDADTASLFTEPASPPVGDHQLLERLRQLYGE